MKSLALIVLMLSAGSFVQDAIPAGTILPVLLESSVRSNKARPGQTIKARVMQDVPLPGNSRIRAGATVIGHVVAVKAVDRTGKAEISLRFNTLVERNRHIRITTNLRALATMLDVSQAQIPESGPDRGTSENEWTTDQIGGEVVYRGGGIVAHGSTVVGHFVSGSSVLVRAASRPGAKCRGEVAGNDQPQALWVFSSDACGIYDYPDIRLVHAGRTDPVGEITLESTRSDLNLRGGSGMLLRVNPD